MINLILFGTFFIMLLLNIPIAVSLGTSAFLRAVRQHHGQGRYFYPSGQLH